MSDQNQAGSATQLNKTNRPKAKAALASEHTEAGLGLAQAPADSLGIRAAAGDDATQAALQRGPAGVFGGGSFENQAARLSDTRLPVIQRQALATQIGQVQGNRHLQRLVQTLKQNRRTSNQSLNTSILSNSSIIQRDGWDTAVDAVSAVGKGIYSVGEDLVGGTARTLRGLNVFDTEEEIRIAGENERAYNLLKDLVSGREPLEKLVSLIIKHFYNNLPDKIKAQVNEAVKHGVIVGGAKLVGRMVIGKQLATMLARRIAVRIAATQTYKTLATKLGVSAGAGSTGIGIPITLLMLQGTLERAGDASRRLADEDPQLYQVLKYHNLDMAWFLVEPYLGELRGQFDEKIDELIRATETLRPSEPSPVQRTVSPSKQRRKKEFTPPNMAPDRNPELSISSIVQREETDHPYQLGPPSLLQSETPRLPFSLGEQLHLAPEILAQIRAIEFMQRQLEPAQIKTALLQIDPGSLPLPPTPNPLATPLPTTTSSLPPAGVRADLTEPRAGTPSDLLKAILRLPEVDQLVTNLQTSAGNWAEKQFDRLGAGGQVAAVSVTIAIGAGALARILPDPELRETFLSPLEGKVLPVPTLDWLGVELYGDRNQLIFGLHLDVGRLLPSQFGFGPSAPTAMGGPPKQETQPGR